MLRWEHAFRKDCRILGDHYERGYGDLEWRGFCAQRILPWYFMVQEGEQVHGYGVKTNPNAFCLWQLSDTDLSLYLDVRSLGAGVKLGEKTLEMAQLTSYEGKAGESAFDSTRAYCRLLYPNGIIAPQPVYGGNNWYYAYGKSSQEEILLDTDRIASWGYELIKHDFSTYDITGRWGFEMRSAITGESRSFHDGSVTTAQAMKALYKTIYENAGSALIIGCNTVGHLITGYAQIQRTGDDTSGLDWERTRTMEVNTLSHRMPQHQIFFESDADCVGLTQQVPWKMNRQWLDLLARSATPLFVSADPKALTPEIEEEIKKAFALASQNRNPLVPLD